MKAGFDFIPLFEKKAMYDLARRINVGVELNKPGNHIELRKELIPVMLKLIETAWDELEKEEGVIRPAGAMIQNFFKDDSGPEEECFSVLSVNSDGTGFYCGRVVMFPEPNAILS